MSRTLESFERGSSDHPLLEATIGRRFEEALATWAEREALVVRHQGVRWTYREFAAKIDAFATGLLALGLQPGDRVGIWSPNNAEWAVTQFATAKAGMVLVTINPAYRIAEVEYALNKVGCKGLVFAGSHKTSDYVAMLRTLAPEIAESEPGQLRAHRLPDLNVVIKIGAPLPGMMGLDQACALGTKAHHAQLAAIAATLTPDDPINIQFTSGTTGAPKGATLTHRNILNNAYFSGRNMRFSTQDRLCVPVPLYHTFGMVLSNLLCMLFGAAAVYPNEGFDPISVLETVEQERCTALHGVPTMFIAEMEHPQFSKFDLSTLRTGIMAGSPCPIEVMRRVVDVMHLGEITIGYGMTETSPLSCQGSPDDSLERRVTTVGRVHPHVEIKIVNSRGDVIPRGEPGELLVRGYSVMLRYWNDDEKTKDTIDAEGWLHTGDLATLDAEGYCNIVGRLKDMVIRGGENIYPREIEELLYTFPKVEAAQAFGVPDPKFGEQLCVWVKLREGADATVEEIRNFCKERVAHFKVPQYVRFVHDFPMTVTGKARKHEMRSLMSKELGLSESTTA